MSSFRFVLVFLALAAVGTLATAQKSLKPDPMMTLTAADLDRLAAAPSIEQAILRAAADKLRQDRQPTDKVELQVPVRISLLTNQCYEICVGSGLHLACTHHCHNPN